MNGKCGNAVLVVLRLCFGADKCNVFKMGRKIPGKKHRTVKDPYKQQAKRFESLKLKINNPPSNSDEQPIPNSLLRIMELKKKAKQEVVNKPKMKVKVKRKKQTLPCVAQLLDKDRFQPGMTKPDKFIPNLVKKPNESTESFLRRINRMTENLINEVKFEKQFGVEIKKDLKTGEVLEVKNVKHKKIKSKKKKLCEKRKAKLELKKENLKNIKDFNQLKDNVEFGEVVHQPPNLKNLKKINKSKEKTESSRYSNLLLNNLATDDKEKPKSRNSGLEKEKAEKERKFIVEAYRKVKKKKV